MAKRKSDISLSFVLLRFAFVLLGSMLLCLVAFLALQTGLERAGLIYHGSVSNQQAEAFLAEKPQEFLTPGEDFLPFYAPVSYTHLDVYKRQPKICLHIKRTIKRTRGA